MNRLVQWEMFNLGTIARDFEAARDASKTTTSWAMWDGFALNLRHVAQRLARAREESEVLLVMADLRSLADYVEERTGVDSLSGVWRRLMGCDRAEHLT